MTSQSPRKPWEMGAGGSSTIPFNSGMPLLASNPHISSSGQTATSTSSAYAQAPALPARPSSLRSVVRRTASYYAPSSTGSRYGAAPYGRVGGVGSMNNYSSPYSRFGNMGNSMYGGYGSMYGGMGGMYGGMRGYPQPGMPGEDSNSLASSFSQSTEATFQIIESIVGAFGGFAQMLESTYMATHSSFYAMISVAEQLSTLRDTLGSILGIFAILRWMRTLLAKITGRPPPADATALTPSAFARFQGRIPTLPDGSPAPPRPSKKPFLVFIIAAFGLPYLMGKLIRALARSQDEAAQRQQQNFLLGPNGQPLSPDQQLHTRNQQEALHPSRLDFCRVLYDYVPENQPGTTGPTNGIDLAVKKGDLVAVLSRSDPSGSHSEWWRCRSRDGRVGYLPSPYLEVIQRKPKAIDADGSLPSPPGSRAQTMTSDVSTEDAKEPVLVPPAAPTVNEKPGDITIDAFHRSQFYS